MASRILSYNLIILLTFIVFTKSENYRKCNETFCARLRDSVGKPQTITLDFGSTLKITNLGVEADLNIKSTAVLKLKFKLEVVENSVFHLTVDEPTSTRYRPTDALLKNFQPVQVTAVKKDNLITVTHGKDKALIYASPFKVEFYNNNNLVSIVNPSGRLIFEKQTNQFAVAADVSFPNTQHPYGIPLHVDNLALRNTREKNYDPYCLYNLESKGNETKTSAIHGSVPVVYAHGTKQSSGIFWLNSALTWIEITTKPNQVDAYFMSEEGAIDIYALLGPTLPQAVIQYSKLTGVAPLPPYFSLGYHQSRHSWSQYDLIEAASKFPSSDLPLDAIWLDVGYTDNMKYFTWDPDKYPRPYELLHELDRNHQRIVAVINPYLVIDNSYSVYLEAKQQRYYIQDQQKKDYTADCQNYTDCQANWLDFLNPAVSKFYSDQFRKFKTFEHSSVHIWNDMNEPTAFNSPENTIPPWAFHYNGRRHSEVHNIYGLLQTNATHAAMLNKQRQARPFLLTTSHFAGSQRYAAVWTGNRNASWDNLRISLPMCLTEALAGISFCGADVGGFYDVPDDELYVRWYQAGAWLPFYRGNYDINVPSREPYLYGEQIQMRIRAALRQRYAHIPLWYLLFKEHQMTGEPVIRPLTYHYPKEKEALTIDDQILVGPNVLVAPVLTADDKKLRNVYLPGGDSEIWYNINDHYNISYGIGYQSFHVTLDSIPVFYRGGSIIPRKDKPRNSTYWLCSDRYTIYIAPGKDGKASGTLYDDDCEYYSSPGDTKYHKVYAQMTFNGKELTSKPVEYNGNAAHIEKIVILNPANNIKEVRLSSEAYEYPKNKIMYNVTYYNDGKSMEVTLDDFKFATTLNPSYQFKVEFISSGPVAKLSGWLLIVLAIRYVLFR